MSGLGWPDSNLERTAAAIAAVGSSADFVGRRSRCDVVEMAHMLRLQVGWHMVVDIAHTEPGVEVLRGEVDLDRDEVTLPDIPAAKLARRHVSEVVG